MAPGGARPKGHGGGPAVPHRAPVSGRGRAGAAGAKADQRRQACQPAPLLLGWISRFSAFSLPSTGLTSRRRSPSEFLSLKPQRRSKPRILAGCSTRRSPHRRAIRRSTSLYSGGTRPARCRVVCPRHELICVTCRTREGNVSSYNPRDRGCGHVVHEALVFSFASTGPMGSSASRQNRVTVAYVLPLARFR